MFCLCRKSVLPGLTAFLAGGGRKIDAWYAKLKVVEVLFDDNPDAFSNINTEAELKAFEDRPLQSALLIAYLVPPASRPASSSAP